MVCGLVHLRTPYRWYGATEWSGNNGVARLTPGTQLDYQSFDELQGAQRTDMHKKRCTAIEQREPGKS